MPWVGLQYVIVVFPDHTHLLFHYNAPAHKVHHVTEFLRAGVTVLPHPSYSLDLSPCEYFLFPKLKYLEEIQFKKSIVYQYPSFLYGDVPLLMVYSFWESVLMLMISTTETSFILLSY